MTTYTPEVQELYDFTETLYTEAIAVYLTNYREFAEKMMVVYVISAGVQEHYGLTFLL